MLLGTAKVFGSRAQGESEHFGMSVYAARRIRRRDRAGIAGDAFDFSLEARLSNL